MIDLSLKYMGLTLSNPIIASSSGLTNSLDNIIKLAENGVGAVVLQSLYEEEIVTELKQNFRDISLKNNVQTESMNFYKNINVEDTLTSYLSLITNCKKRLKIPIIASINCISSDYWPYFTELIQKSGADGLELNISINTYDPNYKTNQSIEMYYKIIEAVKKHITIPIAIKISPFFSEITSTLTKLSETEIDGMVLFNKFYSPDIDINKVKLIDDHKYSSENDYSLPLRSIGVLSKRAHCDLSASTGIHNSEVLIKMLLAGAKTVHIASVLYKNGFEHLGKMRFELETWMKEHNYSTINDFRGILSQDVNINQAAHSRVQFMQHYNEKG
ncbi:dihydroorotate dehydrogenase-like protein [Saccharicrinis aurantiacus]|uniref:dihydroorotate dehydrogenase-like protein n=1 Tax=Saccharicrinis aurantiacus TaxID=1849719 RepID=UPI00094F8B98|nr:dihydroorotate dehydrogenase-like protein [Saccharicrinis aurantiacus]